MPSNASFVEHELIETFIACNLFIHKYFIYPTFLCHVFILISSAYKFISCITFYHLSINATEANGFGKYVNDCCPSNANTKMKVVYDNDETRYLCLFACIEGVLAGTELRESYMVFRSF